MQPSQKRYSCKEWQAFSQEFKESGLNAIDFCKSKGLNWKTFHRWCQRFKKDSLFIPVHLNTRKKKTLLEKEKSSDKVIFRHREGYQIEFPLSIPSKKLSKILRGIL